ncbi:MAG: hypothetical protein ABI560_10920 [Myxococcales bacterium]
MLLVVARTPPASQSQAFIEAARLTGLSPADVRTRLAGPLPRVLHIEPDGDRARELAAELEGAGFAVLVCEPRAAPGDDERLQARGLRLAGGILTVIDGAGGEEELPLSALSLIQRGTRTTTSTEVTKKTERRLDVTRALLTGGLMLTKKVEKKTTRTTTARESFLLLHRGDGERDVMVYERRLDYRFLGADLQPASAANFDRLLARLRAAAPRVPFDDRVNRPGFLSGLPAASSATVDLALWLVHLVHLRGWAGT